MNPRIKDVKALQGYKLLLTFFNGEKKIYHMDGTLEKGIFKELKDERLFKYGQGCQWYCAMAA